MRYIQDSLNALDSAQEQVLALDSNWNTLSVPPGEHAEDSGYAGKNDVITVQFYISTQFLIDRDKSIDFLILDEENYQLYRNGNDYQAFVNEDDLESGTFSRSIPADGVYHVVFDNNDDLFFEPEEEVKYRFVIYTTRTDESIDHTMGLLLLLPSITLMGVGVFGLWSLRKNDKDYL